MSGDIGRNDPCPCGSGKKYKKCCLRKDQEAAPHSDPVDPDTAAHAPDDILDETAYAAAALSEKLSDLLAHWFDTFADPIVEEWGPDHPLHLLVDEVEVVPPVNEPRGWLNVVYAYFGRGVSEVFREDAESFFEAEIEGRLDDAERRLFEALRDTDFGMWRIRTTSSGKIRAAALRPDAPTDELSADGVRMPAAPPQRGDVLSAGWLLSYDGVRLLLVGAPLSKPNRRLFEAALARDAWGKGETFRRDHYEADLLALSFAPCIDTGGTGVAIDDEAGGGRVFLDADVDEAISVDLLWNLGVAAFFSPPEADYEDPYDYDDDFDDDFDDDDDFFIEVPAEGLDEHDADTFRIPSPFYQRWLDASHGTFDFDLALTRFEQDAGTWLVRLAWAAEVEDGAELREELRLLRNHGFLFLRRPDDAFGPYSLEYRLPVDEILERLGLGPDARLAQGESDISRHPLEALSLPPGFLEEHELRADQPLGTALARLRRDSPSEALAVLERHVAHHRAGLRWLKLVEARIHAGPDTSSPPLFQGDIVAGCRIFAPSVILDRPLSTLEERGHGTITRVIRAMRKAEFVAPRATPTVGEVFRYAELIPGLPGIGEATRNNLVTTLFVGLRTWAMDLDVGAAVDPQAHKDAMEGLDALEALFGDQNDD